jgi:hypothetical protein
MHSEKKKKEVTTARMCTHTTALKKGGLGERCTGLATAMGMKEEKKLAEKFRSSRTDKELRRN